MNINLFLYYQFTTNIHKISWNSVHYCLWSRDIWFWDRQTYTHTNANTRSQTNRQTKSNRLQIGRQIGRHAGNSPNVTSSAEVIRIVTSLKTFLALIRGNCITWSCNNFTISSLKCISNIFKERKSIRPRNVWIVVCCVWDASYTCTSFEHVWPKPISSSVQLQFELQFGPFSLKRSICYSK